MNVSQLESNLSISQCKKLAKTLHLTSSRFFGGPERQMLGLAQAGRDLFETSFASFSEQGLCRDFLGRVAQAGFPHHELQADTPHLLRAVKEVHSLIKAKQIDVLLVHGYKAGLIGWRAARRAGIPVIAVSRGWTRESWKVHCYERLDKLVLRWVDAVVCVSQAQADKVRRCGVATERIHLIPNAIDTNRFRKVAPSGRAELESLFGDFFSERPLLVGAAGRLSPEKGFDILIAAAVQVLAVVPQSRFLIFGEGALRGDLEHQINQSGMEQRVKLAGFRQDLDRLLPHLDLFVQSSHTEGMPNVLLEALAAGVPIVATAVGGTPEIIDSGHTGELVPSRSVSAQAESIQLMLTDSARRLRYGTTGKQAIENNNGFFTQSRDYQKLFASINAFKDGCSGTHERHRANELFNAETRQSTCVQRAVAVEATLVGPRVFDCDLADRKE